MMAWTEFTLALAAFLAAHILPLRFKGALVQRFGRRGYLTGYSLLSLGLLFWLIAAAGRAPVVPLWPHEPWMRWLVNLVMPLALFLGATAGLAGVLGGFALWAAAHALANGDLAHLLLFGLLLAYALAGFARLRRLPVLRLGWQRIALWLGLWGGLYLLHAPLIGVSPVP